MTDLHWNQLCAAVQALADAGVPEEIQNLLLYGSQSLGVKPKALENAISAAARAAVLASVGPSDLPSREILLECARRGNVSAVKALGGTDNV